MKKKTFCIPTGSFKDSSVFQPVSFPLCSYLTYHLPILACCQVFLSFCGCCRVERVGSLSRSSYSSMITTSPPRFAARNCNRSLSECYNNRPSGTLLNQKSRCAVAELLFLDVSFVHETCFWATLALLLEHTITPSILWFPPPALQEVPTIFLHAAIPENYR